MNRVSIETQAIETHALDCSAVRVSDTACNTVGLGSDRSVFSSILTTPWYFVLLGNVTRTSGDVDQRLLTPVQ